ncbi:MAG: formylglycine-generating enzyme family protein [Thermomonas sp.]|uniref:formylglycine-generating enzyme family protein n=1 Tax=Thermomonas sp. TaxID=1971895 RepID=UPI001DDE9294|nr:formylglycine-generating enzyme family protein [Thermomonas sp.]MBZ0088094.1 formylglycine-generating enzyme family protein [Thermomonas sp.]
MVAMLVACGRDPAPPARSAATPAPAAAAGVVAPAPRSEGEVSIQGDDALAGVLSWSLPEVKIEHPARARAEARRALANGDLFETEHSAIPLLLALRKLQPDNPDDGPLLAKARSALLAQANAALGASEDPASLRYAQRMGTVLRLLWPADRDVQEYLERVDQAERAFDMIARGFALLRAGRLDDPDGALASFRAAQALWPAQIGAGQGMAAVEAVLIARAQTQALAGDFDTAGMTLERARRVRDDARTLAVAKARVEATRADSIRRLGDAGMMALADPAGLQFARERLVDMLRIARPGDRAAVVLRERIDVVSHYGLFYPGEVFSDQMPDGSRAPSLVVLRHGSFMMGAAADEPGASADEQPRHRIEFERGFAMTRHEITVAEFRRFVQATGYATRASQRGHSMIYDVRSGNFARVSGVDWRSGYDGQPAAGNLPVVHVTAWDAEAYAAWLSAQTDAHYRLPSEAEFEYALRAGGRGRFPWGNGGPPAGVDNFAGGKDASPRGLHWNNSFPSYGDGWWGPAPVGSFARNAFGLFDMGGNVSEWVADCWHKGYRRAPANGAAWVNPGCRTRMYRGGSWASGPDQLRSAWRVSGGVDITNSRIGFRLVRQL